MCTKKIPDSRSRSCYPTSVSGTGNPWESSNWNTFLLSYICWVPRDETSVSHCRGSLGTNLNKCKKRNVLEDSGFLLLLCWGILCARATGGNPKGDRHVVGNEMWDRIACQELTYGGDLCPSSWHPVPRHLVPHSPSWSLHRPGL